MNTLQPMRTGSLLAYFIAAWAPRPGARADARPAARPGMQRPKAAGEATTVTLPRAATHWVQRPRGRVVTCEAGTLWLTFDGEERDIVLEAGECHACESDAPLAIHALAAARLHLSARPVRG